MSLLKNLIPTMISNTMPSGIATAHSVYGGTTYPAYYAMDDNPTTFWHSASDGFPGYLTYAFNRIVPIDGYSLGSRIGFPYQSPVLWNFLGYRNGGWVVLDSQTFTGWKDYERHYFPLTQTARYSAYSISVLQCGNGADIVLSHYGLFRSYSKHPPRSLLVTPSIQQSLGVR